MSDIEIAMWSLILVTKINNWDVFDTSIYLLITAYQAKVLI